MIEPIGLITVLAGFVALARGYEATVALLIVFTLLGAAAAVLVGALNVQPAHLLLGFAALSLTSRRKDAGLALRSIGPQQPGFWLFCFTVYAVISAIFLPRIFAGLTDIVPLGSSEYADTGSTVPLGPVSSNVTQSVYMVASLVCFCMVASLGARKSGFHVVLMAMIAVCAANAAFAFLDLGTYMTKTQGLLDFMRNARYTMHHEEEVYGLKRIVGSFTEASVFSRTTLGALGFSGTLWLCRYRTRWTGPLALVSFGLVIFSTSTGGLAGLVPLGALLYLTALGRCGVQPGAVNSSIFVLAVPLVVVLVIFVVLLQPTLSAIVYQYLETVVLSKGTTASGIERAGWNFHGWQNFVDTAGIGVGLGTARTSSLVYALLSNVGVIGTALYAVFLFFALVWKRGTPRTLYSDVRLAARNGCVGLMIADVLSGATVEQGLLFYALAALACAEPELETSQATASPAERPGLVPA